MFFLQPVHRIESWVSQVRKNFLVEAFRIALLAMGIFSVGFVLRSSEEGIALLPRRFTLRVSAKKCTSFIVETRFVRSNLGLRK